MRLETYIDKFNALNDAIGDIPNGTPGKVELVTQHAAIEPPLKAFESAVSDARKVHRLTATTPPIKPPVATPTAPPAKMDFHYLRIMLNTVGDRAGIAGDVGQQTTDVEKFIAIYEKIKNALQSGDATAFEKAKNELHNSNNPSFENVVNAMDAHAADLKRAWDEIDPPDPATAPKWHIEQYNLLEKYSTMNKIINNIVTPGAGLNNLDFSLMDRNAVVDSNTDVATWLATNVPGNPGLASATTGFGIKLADPTERTPFLLEGQKSIGVLYIDKNTGTDLASRRAKKESAVCIVTERNQGVFSQTVTVAEAFNPIVIMKNAMAAILTPNGITNASLNHQIEALATDIKNRLDSSGKLYTAKDFNECIQTEILQTKNRPVVEALLSAVANDQGHFYKGGRAILAETLANAIKDANDPKALLTVGQVAVREMMQKKGFTENEWAGKRLEITDCSMGPAAVQAMADIAAFHKMNFVNRTSHLGIVGNPKTIPDLIKAEIKENTTGNIFNRQKPKGPSDFEMAMHPTLTLPPGVKPGATATASPTVAALTLSSAPTSPTSTSRSSISGTPPPIKAHKSSALLTLHSAATPTPKAGAGATASITVAPESKSAPSSPSSRSNRGGNTN
jgi:hypothetical protein